MLASTLSWRENVEQSSTYQHCYRSRAKRALEASAMFIRTTRRVLQHVTGTRTLSNEHHQIEFLRCRHRCSRTAEHKKITRPLERAYQTFQRFFVVCVSIIVLLHSLAGGHNLSVNKSINRAVMRTKEEKENVRIQEVQLYRELL